MTVRIGNVVRGSDSTGGNTGITLEDITRLNFISYTDRNTYFQANMDKLEENLLIRVLIDNETIESQQWTSSDSPVVSYNAMFWKVNSIQVGSSSFHLSGAHTLSSVGENIVFTNEISGIDWFPLWQSRFFPPTGRSYTSRNAVEVGGVRDNTKSTDFNVSFTVNNFNTELSSILYVPTENYIGRLEYRVTDNNTGITVFNDIIYDVTLVSGQDYIQEFTSPLELFVGADVTAEILKNDGSYVTVQPELVASDRPYTTSTISFFEDKEIPFTEDIPDIVDDIPKVFMEAYMSHDEVFNVFNEEKAIDFDTVSANVGLVLHPNGELEATVAGRYTGHLVLRINETSDPQIVLWNEIKPISTGVWELSGGMVKTRFRDDGDWTLSLDGSLSLNVGDRVRVKCMVQGFGSDRFTLEGITENVDLGTVMQPSASITIKRDGKIV